MVQRDRAPLDGLKIAQVERLTGVGAHTLRAWERRYGIPRPARSRGQQRLYTVSDVEVIRRMQGLAASGFALPRAAAIALAERGGHEPAGPRPPGEVERLLQALLDFDERRALRLWAEALDSSDLLALFEQLAVPVLTSLGDAWHRGEAGVEQEHFASNFLRARLETLLRQSMPIEGAPCVLLACPAGERHELALLMLNVLLRFQGIATVYLGQDVPGEAIVRAIARLQPAAVCISAGGIDSAAGLRPLVSEITHAAPRACVLFGGKAADDDQALRDLPGAVYAGASLGEALQAVVRETRRQAERKRP